MEGLVITSNVWI